MDIISSLRKDTTDRVKCEPVCTRYSWCRGIIVNEIVGLDPECGLLAKKNSGNITGWIWNDSDIWVEPDKWKNSSKITDRTIGCYEKTKTFIGMYIT